jgi:hypothetical protein
MHPRYSDQKHRKGKHNEILAALKILNDKRTGYECDDRI